MAGRDLKTAGDDEKFKEGRTSISAVMKKKKKEKKKKDQPWTAVKTIGHI